jgi:hypothetical protein
MMLYKGTRLACYGICLSDHFTTKVIFWLLKTTCRVPGVAYEWRTLLTDDDSAFAPAVASFRRTVNFPEDLRHPLCTMHKKRNLVIKAHSCGISKATRVPLSSLFDMVAFCDHKDMADKAIRQVQQMKIEKPNKYLEGHISRGPMPGNISHAGSRQYQLRRV